jgi:membrane-bound lytic murein transglycosylase D
MHRVRRGQTLSSIASAYGTTVRAIQVWNDIPNPDRLKVGDSLTIWAGVRTASPYNHTAMVSGERSGAKTASEVPAGSMAVHTVRGGDTLWSVARAYGMTVRELRAQNPKLGRSNVIRPGDRLTVNARSGGGLERIVHRVRAGETLWDIASRYDTTVGQLRLWNGLGRRDNLIRPGDTLTLYR